MNRLQTAQSFVRAGSIRLSLQEGIADSFGPQRGQVRWQPGPVVAEVKRRRCILAVGAVAVGVMRVGRTL
jgi:hypothetical protein